MQGRGSCRDLVDVPHLIASPVAPKVGAMRKYADAAQTYISLSAWPLNHCALFITPI